VRFDSELSLIFSVVRPVETILLVFGHRIIISGIPHYCISAGQTQQTTRDDYNLPRGNCFATAHTSRTINGGAAPQAADLNVVVGAVDAGVMMQAMMLWLLLHYQRILDLRNAWL